jgi:hypothetical protein
MDKALEFTLFEATYEVVLFNSPLSIAITVGVILIAVMATLALTQPALYQRFFVAMLGFVFALAAAGTAYCWGMSAGIVEGFETSRDLNAALAIHDMAAEWRMRSLWFSLGFVVFCVLHFLFAYVARWAWLRRSRQPELAPDTPEQPSGETQSGTPIPDPEAR